MKVACRKLRGVKKRGDEEGVLKLRQLQRVRTGGGGVRGRSRKEKKEMRKRTVRKIREQGGKSSQLFRTDLRGKWKERRLNRIKDKVRRILEGEDAMLEMLARHWEELGMGSKDCSEDDVVPDTEMGDVGGCELRMSKEANWEEVVEVLKCLRIGKALGPDGILNGCGRLVEVMPQVMNLV